MKGIVMIGCVFLMACGVPIKVKRVDPTSEVKGVRYTVLRPSYQAALFLTDNQTWKLTLEQKLDQPVVFEARSHVNPLATTDLSFTIEDDGKLTGVMGGQTDKTLETIQAAAGLAKSFAPAAPKAKGAFPDCSNFVDVGGYETRHRAMQARAHRLEDTIDRVGQLEPTHDRLEHLQALRDELKAAEDARDADTLPIPAAQLGIQLDSGGYVSGDAASCVQITLHKTLSL